MNGMTVQQWIDSAMRGGNVCNDYMRKWKAAETKAEKFRVLCDVNGGAWLFDLHANGAQLPIGQFMKEYAAYVNGGKTVEYPSGYTSKFYCRNLGEIEADTTIVYLLECMDADVHVPMNHYPTLVLSDGSQAEVTLDDGARLNVELYGDSCINGINGDKSKVRITQHRTL